MTDQEYRKSATALAVSIRGQTSSNSSVTTIVIATSTGKSKRITSQAANEDAHTLRRQYDVILVDKHTILHNPSLTTRRPRGGHHPIRIVFDSEHTIPITNKILQDQLQNERREVHVHRHY